LGESKIPVLDLAANQDDLGKLMTGRLQPDFTPFGFTLCNLTVENISLPPEVEQAMDKRTSMGVIGNLNAYTQFQTANAIGDAAKNPSGVAASGVGLGMGIGMAQQVNDAMRNNASTPPPLSAGAGAAGFFIAIEGKQT